MTQPAHYIVARDLALGRPFSIVTTSHLTADGLELVAYSGGKTLAAYLAERPDCEAVAEAEFDRRYAAHEASLKTQPTPITAEQFDDWLNCLPPCRWHTVRGVEVFHVSERLTGNLVQWCAHLGGAYWAWTDDAAATQAQLGAHAATIAAQLEMMR